MTHSQSSAVSPPPSTPTAQRALDQLRQMIASVEQAIAALSTNSLRGIEDCLWTQETLSALLRRSLHELRHARISPVDAGELRTAAMRLLALNRCYELIVQEAARTAALLRSLTTGSAHDRQTQPAKTYTSLSYEI